MLTCCPVHFNSFNSSVTLGYIPSAQQLHMTSGYYITFYCIILYYTVLYSITKHFHHCSNFCWKTWFKVQILCWLCKLQTIFSLCFRVLRYSPPLGKCTQKFFLSVKVSVLLHNQFFNLPALQMYRYVFFKFML